jgi:hypothetical protein
LSSPSTDIVSWILMGMVAFKAKQSHPTFTNQPLLAYIIAFIADHVARPRDAYSAAERFPP